MTQFKYLGIWLDLSLTWSIHVDKLVKNVDKCVGILQRASSVLPRQTLNLLYKTLILPRFDYCDAVWGNAAKVLFAKLEKIQITLEELSWASSEDPQQTSFYPLLDGNP